MRKFSAVSPASVRATRPLSATRASQQADRQARRRSPDWCPYHPASGRTRRVSGMIEPVAFSVSPPSRSRPASPENGAMLAVSSADVAGEIEPVELPRQRRRQRLPDHAQLGQLHRLARIPEPGNADADAVAQRRLRPRRTAEMPDSVPSPLKVSMRAAGSSRSVATPPSVSATVSAAKPGCSKPGNVKLADQSASWAPSRLRRQSRSPVAPSRPWSRCPAPAGSPAHPPDRPRRR